MIVERAFLIARRLLELPEQIDSVGSYLRNHLYELSSAVNRLAQTPQTPQPRADVLVLWHSDDDRHPCCMCRSGVLGTPITFRADAFPVPAGAWIVALKGELREVFVGVDLQNFASTEGQGTALRLNAPVPLGAALRVFVVPTS